MRISLKRIWESVTLSNGTLLNTNAVLLLLDKYPTSYDVDKVVEELNEIICPKRLYFCRVSKVDATSLMILVA